MQLRPYQQTLAEQIRERFKAGDRRVLAVSPTGSGKTVLFSFITKNAIEKGNRVFILAHRSEILDQIEATLRQVDVPIGAIRAGEHNPSFSGVTVASVQTLVRRLDRVQAPNLIITDEAHHGVSETYRKIFQAFSGSLVLGVTATPERLDGKGLGEFFQSIVVGPSTAWLINEGFLAKPRYFSTPVQPDLEAVRRIAGDYATGDLERAMDKPVITGDAIDHYRRICDGRTAIAFCASVNHAEHVAAQFQAVGIASQSIDGRLAPEERRRRVLDLSQGQIRVLTSCELVSEGFDLPSVGAAILLRPTASLAMHLQQLGRALRPKPDGSGCVILDHAGNCMRHGLAEEHRDWTLEGRTAKKRDKETVLSTKTCPKCFAIFTGQTCPQCGTTQEKPREIETVPGELVELAFDQHYETKRKESECRSIDDWRKLAKQRGYKPGWAWYRWSKRRLREVG